MGFNKQNINKVFNHSESILKYKNPTMFIEKYMIGYDAGRGTVEPLKLFHFQTKILRHIEDNKFSIFLKSRQQYMDTLMAAYILHYMIFNCDKTVVYLAPKMENSYNFMEKFKTMMHNVPFCPETIINNQTTVKLSNGSFLKCASDSANSVLGFSIDILLVSEGAFFKNLREIHTCTIAAIFAHENTKSIFYSNPGPEDYFYNELWSNSIIKDNIFAPKQIHWKDNPNCTDKWYQEQCLMLGNDEDVIDTELDLQFMPIKQKNIAMLNIRVPNEMNYDIIKRATDYGSVSNYVRTLILKDLSNKE